MEFSAILSNIDYMNKSKPPVEKLSVSAIPTARPFTIPPNTANRSISLTKKFLGRYMVIKETSVNCMME